jgi:hypothetical protein
LPKKELPQIGITINGEEISNTDLSNIKKINKKTNLEEYKKDIEVNELLEYRNNKIMKLLIKIINE